MMKRIAIVLDGITPVNTIVLGAGAKGDEWLEANPNAVEVTGLDPQPGVRTGIFNQSHALCLPGYPGCDGLYRYPQR